jgi:CheY-like chemotaxis protein
LVDLHGGQITVRSEGLGHGSEFTIRLPVAIDRAALPSRETPAEFKPNGKRRILVVDDNRDNANSLSMLLKLTGNETSVAYDGEQAVEAAASQRPDVIILDIGLPKLNGYDACRKIRANDWAEGVLIIALTGWGQEEDRRKSAAAGFDAHLVKPVDHSELMRLLSSKVPRNEAQLASR